MMQYLLYIDPGSGSFIVQIIAAAALGISFFFRSIKMFFKNLFTRTPKKPNDNPPA